MKNFALMIAALFVITVFANVLPAQTPKRITFAKNTSEKTVSGTMSGFGSKRVFVIRVKAGQTMTTENVGDHYITISIKPPKGSTYEQDMAANCHDRNEVTGTVAGDYIITVTEYKKADPWKGRFKFKVAVH